MVGRKKNSNFQITLDVNKLIIIALLLVIASMVAIWKPWSAPTNRTVSVVGEAKIAAEPDEFVFYPNYQFTNADKDTALGALSTKSDEIVKKLKELGIAENKIKTSSGGNDFKAIYPGGGSTEPTYTLTLTVTANSREAAQKVSDYLVSTSPLGSISPQPGFSDAKRKQIESQARDKAVANAKEKAEQNARNTGARLGKVKEVADGEGFNNGAPIPYATTAADSARSLAIDTVQPTLSVVPGETELRYSVHVTYFVR